MDPEREKQIAAQAAAELVKDGMRVGLGTGTTVAYLLSALADKRATIVCVATSPQTERAAKALGIVVEPFNNLDRLDLAIDGADQVAPSGWLIKGGGGAHTREKLVATAADRFVVIVDSTKLVDVLHSPVPLELLSFGLRATLRHLTPTKVREGHISPDGGIIADYTGVIEDPSSLCERLSMTPGVIEHGLFPPELVAEVLVGCGETVTRSTRGDMK